MVQTVGKCNYYHNRLTNLSFFEPCFTVNRRVVSECACLVPIYFCGCDVKRLIGSSTCTFDFDSIPEDCGIYPELFS